MFFHLSALSVFLVVAFFLIYYRARLFSLAARFLPDTIVNRLSHYTPLESYSFADQAEAGMSSGNFDLEANIGEGSGEGRLGLDEAGVEEVRRIMAIERCTFDQARLIRHNRILAKNGIAPDGTPLDRKAITHL
ncbi:hypothetical protein J008_05046 [Cryptococcus neoformans]|nr:hypothetical protein C362_04572 [Cryptococcus neoformans var. grubii Bt1]OWZ35528.1 hypothetical protein C356_05036 [Cryptococcus neoformans var. grubii c45]OWZ76707.1 hypothetical protein C365_04862 [Cryptococcus neoformans var. grubii Bt85]OXB35303.1 hypothetical protein J007_04970 [Cryptococcus neoformans var. grubii]OXC59436.1 hypothetical protein C358_05084 [Cryptococcus neoformans var. grubii MW-RSA852]OXG18165.1 hypothetical protein C367_04982 [Cryptococcus neoformans var. grubii Ze9